VCARARHEYDQVKEMHDKLQITYE